MASTFFGIQAAFALAGDPRRHLLADLVRRHRESTDLISQRQCWTQLDTLLGPACDRITLGTWDLLREQANATYEEWASGLEAMATWPVDDFGTNGDLLLVTAIVLVQGGSNADTTLGDLCDLPESRWHRQSTFRMLFQALLQLNLTNVLGSGLYLSPRPDLPGFSREVLTGSGFEYLQRIVD